MVPPKILSKLLLLTHALALLPGLEAAAIPQRSTFLPQPPAGPTYKWCLIPAHQFWEVAEPAPSITCRWQSDWNTPHQDLTIPFRPRGTTRTADARAHPSLPSMLQRIEAARALDSPVRLTCGDAQCQTFQDLVVATKRYFSCQIDRRWEVESFRLGFLNCEPPLQHSTYPDDRIYTFAYPRLTAATRPHPLALQLDQIEWGAPIQQQNDLPRSACRAPAHATRVFLELDFSPRGMGTALPYGCDSHHCRPILRILSDYRGPIGSL